MQRALVIQIIKEWQAAIKLYNIYKINNLTKIRTLGFEVVNGFVSLMFLLRLHINGSKADMKDSGMVCKCGIISFKQDSRALCRFVCHCNLCKTYTNGAYNDETFFLNNDVVINHPELVEFKRNYSNLSPLRRGVCKNCRSPAVSIAKLLRLSLIVVPSELAASEVEVPQICSHVFFHRSIVEPNDILPKYNGYWVSQIMTQLHLIKSLWCHYQYS